MSASRNRELADDLARRAIEAAKRRQAEMRPDPDEFAERLRNAAGEDGRLSIDDAVEALNGGEHHALNDEIRRAGSRSAQLGALAERIFPTPPDPEPSTRPEGEADGGKGEAENYETEYVQTEDGMVRMRVFDLDELNPNRKDLTDDQTE